MSTNLATLIGGPCLVQYKGATFRSKGDVSLSLELETFDIATDLYGAVDKRVSGQPLKVSFTPEGRFADLAVLYPYLAPSVLGSLITPRHECGTVIAAADTIAFANTSLVAGTPVSFGTTGTMPGGLTAGTVYYLSANTGGVRTLHATSAAAIAGSGAIDITSAGTGTLACVEQWPLVILGLDGQRITLHNAAVTKMPSITLKSTETLWGDVEFEGFAKNATPWSTANSLYTIDSATFADAGFDPSDIVTQPYAGTWGAAPWADFYTKGGWAIEPSLSLEAVEDDASGVLTRRIGSLGFTAKAQPLGPSLADLMAKLMLQGSGATRGRSLAGDNLNIVGTDAYIRLYAAALTGGPAQWGTKADRIGELTWSANRAFSAGVAQPLFYIGAAAPA